MQMNGWLSVVLVLASGALGCRSKGGEAACSTQVAELRTWLAAVEREGYFESASGELVGVDSVPEDISERTLLSITAREILADGSSALGSLDDVARLPEQLAGHLRTRRELNAVIKAGREPLSTVGIVLKKNDPWGAVVALSDAALKSEAKEVGYVFAAKSAVTAPSASRVPSAVKRGPDRSQATPGALLDPETLFPKCREIATAIKSISSGASGGPKAMRAWIDLVPNAVEKCGCNVEVNEVKALFWAIQGRYDGAPQHFQKITAGKCGDPDVTTIEASADTPWSTAHRAVLAASVAKKSVCLKVK